jgi:hypothetical protein
LSMAREQFAIRIGEGQRATFARGKGTVPKGGFDGLQEFCEKVIKFNNSPAARDLVTTRYAVHYPVHDWASKQLHDEARELQLTSPRNLDYYECVKEVYRRRPELLTIVVGFPVTNESEADIVFQED